MRTNPAIEIRDLTVERGGKPVLESMTVSVPRGEITGLLGPSGSGKTTLMRAVVGVQIIQSGVVEVLGQPAGAPDLRKSVGYLTQSPSVYPDLTVRENVSYFGSLYGADALEVDPVIDDLGLGGQRSQLVSTLSGGQLSRTSLACVLVSNPRVLVLDEPTVGQDPVLRDELWDRFRHLADRGTTILVSSHIMDEANRCDRLILIRQGSIIADDTPAEVRRAADTDDLDEAFLRLIRQQELNG